MNRNIARKGHSAKKSLASWKMGLLIGFFAIVLGAVATVFYLRTRQPQTNVLVSSYFSRMKTWVSERKTHINQGLVKVKRLAANKNAPPPEIHFEFYTTLPKMQVKLSDLNTTDERSSAPKIQQASILPAPAASAVISASDIEKELSAQLTPPSYVVQLGIFSSKNAAAKYRASLSTAGFEASVVKSAAAGSTIYRVQLGPFKNQNQARMAQKELQRKGLNGIMRKIIIT